MRLVIKNNGKKLARFEFMKKYEENKKGVTDNLSCCLITPYSVAEDEGVEPPRAQTRRFSRPLPCQLGLILLRNL